MWPKILAVAIDATSDGESLSNFSLHPMTIAEERFTPTLRLKSGMDKVQAVKSSLSATSLSVFWPDNIVFLTSTDKIEENQIVFPLIILKIKTQLKYYETCIKSFTIYCVLILIVSQLAIVC